MLKPGDVVNITYYEGKDEYDNGIARLEGGGKAKIVNLRCIGFLSAEIEDRQVTLPVRKGSDRRAALMRTEGNNVAIGGQGTRQDTHGGCAAVTA